MTRKRGNLKFSPSSLIAIRFWYIIANPTVTIVKAMANSIANMALAFAVFCTNLSQLIIYVHESLCDALLQAQSCYVYDTAPADRFCCVFCGARHETGCSDKRHLQIVSSSGTEIKR